MGCFNTFEFRRRELAALQGAEPSAIDDATVVESMYAIARDRDGAARRYLSRAQLAVIAGDSLCVHGAVTATNMSFVPDDRSGDRPQPQPPGHFVAADEGVEQWVTQLNEFARRGVQQWQQHMTWDASRTFRGGHALMVCGFHCCCVLPHTLDIVQCYTFRAMGIAKPWVARHRLGLDRGVSW